MKTKPFVATATIAIGAIAAVLLTPHYAVGILPTVPGVINPDVTQATIQQTICVSGWTATIRPPASYTTALKIKQLAALGWADQNTADYEQDHLISLELGGSPTDPNNLWPQSYKTMPNAHDKDHVENWLKAQVCSGEMTLAEAQKEITTDWTAVLSKLKKQPTQFGATVGSDDPDDD